MDIYNYKADSLADAFDMASRDTTKWDFPARGALAELAADARRHLRKGMRMGMSTIWSSSRGQFNVFVGSKKGIGIGLLGLTGRESGIDDPAASAILEYHRARPEVELYADPLVGFSEQIADINGLDAAYELLMRAGFLSRTDAIVEVTVGDEKVERPKYRLRGPWKPNLPRFAIGLDDGSQFVIDSDRPIDTLVPLVPATCCENLENG